MIKRSWNVARGERAGELELESFEERDDCYYNPGGGTPSYNTYRHVPPQRVSFWCRFGLKTGMAQ